MRVWNIQDRPNWVAWVSVPFAGTHGLMDADFSSAPLSGAPKHFRILAYRRFCTPKTPHPASTPNTQLYNTRDLKQDIGPVQSGPGVASSGAEHSLKNRLSPGADSKRPKRTAR